MLEYLGEDIVSALKAIPGRLDQANYIRGISGEFMRSAVLMFIEKMAVCHMAFDDTSKDTNQLSKCTHLYLCCVELFICILFLLMFFIQRLLQKRGKISLMRILQIQLMRPVYVPLY